MLTLADYYDVYLTNDVLLTEVFENFRNMSKQYYELGPCNMYATAGLAWITTLKMTGVCSEMLREAYQHLFIERSVRGIVAQISTRYAQANNLYAPGCDINTPNNYILYVDCTNLY